MSEQEEGPLRDLAIIAGAQKVEHYEISAYGTARTIAQQLELENVVQLLETTEEEEKAADEKLTEIAMMLYEATEEEPEEEEETVPSSRRASARSAR
jgi:ferritin-like metal-binding protein YciE